MITINVKKKFAEVTINDGKRNASKIVSLPDLHKIFSEKSYFDSGSFPLFGDDNTIGLNRVIKKGNNTLLLIQGLNLCVNVIAERMSDLSKGKSTPFMMKNTVTLQNEDGEEDEEETHNYIYKNVYFPNLLMAVAIKEEGSGGFAVKSSGIHSFEESFLSDKTQLYKFPFSNVYNETSGKICWGDNKLPTLSNVAQAVSLFHSFIGAPMNNDLFRSFDDCGSYNASNAYDLLFLLAQNSEKLNRFPYEDIKLHKATDYKSLINYYITNWI